MHQTDSAIAFCPTSNLFLGSGLFPLKKAWDKGVKVGLGTDIGAGTSFNQLQTLNEAYKVQQLQGEKLSAFESLYHATLGGAKALSLDDRLGNFNAGKEADFVVLDLNATALQQLRQSRAKNIEDTFFALTVILQQLMSMDRLSMSRPNKSRQRRIILAAIVAVCAFALKRDSQQPKN